MQIYSTYLQTAIGVIAITGTEAGVMSVEFTDEVGIASAGAPSILRECLDQLQEYFAGLRSEFSVKLVPLGTPFQRQVWNKLSEVMYGHTISYREMAEAIGNRQAVRAVGRANATNRLMIVIPCHRVVGSCGNLTGYAGGLWRKEWLIRHEQENIPGK